MTTLHDLLSIGFRPTLAGCAVIVIGGIAGWGVAGHVDNGVEQAVLPVRIIVFWVRRVLLAVLKKGSWLVRSTAIFFNNACICALLIAGGAVPTGAWIAVTIVGFSMGVALRVLAVESDAFLIGDESESEPVAEEVLRPDRAAQFGMVLNLIEVPAIVATLGLSMGQLAAPNGLVLADVWRIFGVWVVPALAIAAGAESLWIGRLRPFR